MSLLGLIRDWLIDPIGIIFLLSLLFIVFLVKQRLSVRLLMGVLVWFGMMSLVSAPRLVNPMLLHFENQFQTSPDCLASRPIVLLGGGVDSRVESEDQVQYLSPSTYVRTTAAHELAIQFPDAPILVAGGALRTVTEADVMGHYLKDVGIDPERIYKESQSSNTFENAKNIRELIDQREFDEHVNLVTSALHMKRAKAVFEKHGLTVCPVGVDKKGFEGVATYAWWPQISSLLKFDLLMHEVIALFVYKVSGRL